MPDEQTEHTPYNEADALAFTDQLTSTTQVERVARGTGQAAMADAALGPDLPKPTVVHNVVDI